MDVFSKQVYGSMPSFSSEMIYRIELDTNSKVYTVLTFLGLLMIIVVFLTTM